MINNRQAGRRNRGRNNNNNSGRPGGQGRGGSDNGNRIDNRARGNAAQLLEKYRNMARDAQLSGDRVNAEYYLQFADHYFRVLADNRARQEEAQGIQQQARQQRPWDPESDGDDFDSVDGNAEFEDRSAYAQQGNGNGNREGNRENGGREYGNRDQGQREQSNREQGQRDQAQREGGYRENGQRDNNQRDNGQRDGQRNQGNRENYNRDNNRRNGQDSQQQHRREREEAQPVEAATVPAPSQETAVAPREEGAEPPRRGRGRPPRDRSIATTPAAEAAPAYENETPAAAATVAQDDAPRARRVTRTRRPREEDADHGEPVGIDLAVLPPAIARADNDGEGTPAADEAPRKRTRRVRPAATEAAE